MKRVVFVIALCLITGRFAFSQKLVGLPGEIMDEYVGVYENPNHALFETFYLYLTAEKVNGIGTNYQDRVIYNYILEIDGEDKYSGRWELHYAKDKKDNFKYRISLFPKIHGDILEFYFASLIDKNGQEYLLPQARGKNSFLNGKWVKISGR